MNKWIQKSIEIANGQGYLDRLQAVYPVTRESSREIAPEVKELIRDAYDRKDSEALVLRLLKLEKFPIKDPCVAFLRRGQHFLAYNPRTVERIAQYLYAIGYEKIINGIEEPKEFNRQIGTLFRKWLKTLSYPFLQKDEFANSEIGIAFLDGSDEELMRYANDILGCDLVKGPDLLAKVGVHYVLGEAKFLTDYGGHQNAQFEDALRLLAGNAGNVIRIAVLDGVVWIKGRAKMYRRVRELDKPILTALLLKDFLEELLKSENLN